MANWLELSWESTYHEKLQALETAKMPYAIFNWAGTELPDCIAGLDRLADNI
jgi:hypothetical protein